MQWINGSPHFGQALYWQDVHGSFSGKHASNTGAAMWVENRKQVMPSRNPTMHFRM